MAEAPDCASGMKTPAGTTPTGAVRRQAADGNGVEMVGRIKGGRAGHRSDPADGLRQYPRRRAGHQERRLRPHHQKATTTTKILPCASRAAEKAEMQRRLTRIENKLSEEHLFDRIVGDSEVLRRAVDLARKVAVTDTSVLLTGETGTGKRSSSRKPSTTPAAGRRGLSWRSTARLSRANCSKANCSGHRAGSFTGAAKDKKGLFEEADKGTLFLDEIGEMPVELQAKLLRVLESGEFIKIGETRPTRVDVRLIAATNRDLEKEIAAGNFREDLYFRLSVFRIHLPSLRERPGDIAGYISVFTAQFADKMGRRIDSIDADYIAALERHTWHGNVRELRNAVERSMIMADGNRLTADCLAPEFHAAAGLPTPIRWRSTTSNAATFSGCWNTPGATRPSRPPAGHRHRHAIPQTRRLRGEISPSPFREGRPYQNDKAAPLFRRSYLSGKQLPVNALNPEHKFPASPFVCYGQQTPTAKWQSLSSY